MEWLVEGGIAGAILIGVIKADWEFYFKKDVRKKKTVTKAGFRLNREK